MFLFYINISWKERYVLDTFFAGFWAPVAPNCTKMSLRHVSLSEKCFMKYIFYIIERRNLIIYQNFFTYGIRELDLID